MIKANELRIGNCVLDRGNKILTIDRFIGNKIECDIKGMPDKSENGIPIYYHPFTEEINYLNPIPLTEEWLLKFGFERHHSDYSNGVIYIKDVPNNNEFKWGVYPFELGSGFIINKSKNLKHVHQLQSLYFALTGEELTIKEVNNEQ